MGEMADELYMLAELYELQRELEYLNRKKLEDWARKNYVYIAILHMSIKKEVRL